MTNDLSAPKLVYISNQVTKVLDLPCEVYLSDPNDNDSDVSYCDWTIAETEDGHIAVRICLDATDSTLYLYIRDGWEIPTPIEYQLYGIGLKHGVDVELRPLSVEAKDTVLDTAQPSHDGSILH